MYSPISRRLCSILFSLLPNWTSRFQLLHTSRYNPIMRLASGDAPSNFRSYSDRLSASTTSSSWYRRGKSHLLSPHPFSMLRSHILTLARVKLMEVCMVRFCRVQIFLLPLWWVTQDFFQSSMCWLLPQPNKFIQGWLALTSSHLTVRSKIDALAKRSEQPVSISQGPPTSDSSKIDISLLRAAIQVERLYTMNILAWHPPQRLLFFYWFTQ